MVRLSDDSFRIFISHKHEDAELASTVKDQLEKLIPRGSRDKPITCFVSGEDIVSATDWNRKIKSEMARSHLLLLLFTNSNRNWDWCLYETGLFAKFDAEDVHSIVCLHEDDGMPPGPLGSVQSVPTSKARVAKFLNELCHHTHELSDDWRRGALAKKRIPATRINQAAADIVASFETTLAGYTRTYNPCHRVVLDIGPAKQNDRQIPVQGRVVVSENATTSFTMSMFGLAQPREKRTWGDLLDQVNGRRAPWRKDLDQVYALALRRELFTPVSSTLTAWDDESGKERKYKPILYEIERRALDGRPVGVIVIFDRVESLDLG